MKKLFLTAALLLAAGAMSIASAQGPEAQKATPEQKAEFKASRIANNLLLDDDVTQKFIPVYKAYRLEVYAVNQKYRPAKRGPEAKGQPKTDKEVDELIRNGFKKSREILDIREAYYEKFLKILTPKQIKKMYDEEKGAADKAAHHRFEKNNAHKGGKHHGDAPYGDRNR